MEPGHHIADDTAGFVILPRQRHVQQRACAFRPLHQQRVFLMRKYARGPLPAPPRHQRAAESFLRVQRYFQHGGHTSRPYRQ
jgi:hypothetical protein